MLRLVFVAFLVVAIGFNTSGLLTPVASLTAVSWIVLAPPRVKWNVGLIPLPLILFNVWVLWAFFSGIVTSTNYSLFFSGISRLILLTAMMNLLYLGVANDSRLLTFFGYALLIAGLTQMIAIYFGFLDSSQGLNAARENGLENNPNAFGMKLVLSILGWIFIFRTRMRNVLNISILGIYVVILLPFIAASGSRKSFFLLGFLLLFVLLMFMSKKGKISIKSVLFSAVILILLASYTYENYVAETVAGERLNKLFSEGDDGGRSDLYSFGYKLFRDRPLFGIGYSNYQHFSPLKLYSHSDYIESLTSTGLIGFILYQSVYFVMFVQLMRQRFWKNTNADKRFIGYLSIMLIVMLKIIGFSLILFYNIQTMVILIVVMHLCYNYVQE